MSLDIEKIAKLVGFVIKFVEIQGIENSLDEELRLFYVAITRAKRELYISRAQRRMVRGAFQSSRPSPFLDRLGDSAERTDPKEIITAMDVDEAAAMFAKAYEQLFGKDN